MPFHRIVALVRLLSVALLLATPSLTVASEQPERPTLGEAMQDIATTAEEKVFELEALYRQATDPAEKSALVAEIARVKTEADLDLLRVQIEYARERGDDELAAELEAALDHMLNPPDLTDPEAVAASQARQDQPRTDGGSQ